MKKNADKQTKPQSHPQTYKQAAFTDNFPPLNFQPREDSKSRVLRCK